MYDLLLCPGSDTHYYDQYACHYQVFCANFLSMAYSFSDNGLSLITMQCVMYFEFYERCVFHIMARHT